MQFSFSKYQGTGNDFVLIDNRDEHFPEADHALVKRICDRHFGVGADGLMLLQNAVAYDFRMIYYNADGNESTMCGNGGRCIAAFARQLGIVEHGGTFSAIDGGHEFEISGDVVKLKMIDVDSFRQEGNELVLFTGSPHYVCFHQGIDGIDMNKEARKIRYNDTYRNEGINVNFVEEKGGAIFMRTYERGVEGETLSCGTGTVAVALSIAIRNKIENGPLTIHTPGGQLKVSFEREGQAFTNIWLQGPALRVFEGTISIP